MAKKLYLITYCYTGYREIEVEAESKEEAAGLAETIANELDCGELKDVEAERLEVLRIKKN